MPEPSLAVAVMVAVPTATPVTTPAEVTVATLVGLADQVKLLLMALEGATVAERVVVAPTLTDTVSGAIVMPVTRMDEA